MIMGQSDLFMSLNTPFSQKRDAQKMKINKQSPDLNRVPFEYNPAQKMKKLNRVRDSITEYTVDFVSRVVGLGSNMFVNFFVS